MDPHDEQFESFLREFHPRHPRPLPVTDAHRPKWMFRVAAAVLLTLASGISFWFLSRKLALPTNQETARSKSPGPPLQMPLSKLSTATLTRLALEDPSHLNALLDSSAPSHLPRFDQQNSALHILAKE